MFTYIHLKNFKSFRDTRVDLTDRYNKPKKMILIYGANGSGKSNLASAFFMLAESLRTMDMHSLLESLLSEDNESINKSDVRKKLSPSRDIPALIKDSKMIDSEEPMLIEVGFCIDGHNGRYLIETDDSHLIHERLEYVLVKNKSVYFDMTKDQKKINPRIFRNNSSCKDIRQACEKYWGKHTLLSIVVHESTDKAESYIKDQIIENFGRVLIFLSRLSCKVKFGSRRERGGMMLPSVIMSDYESGKIPVEKEDLLDHSEKMLNIFLKASFRDITKAYYKKEKEGKTIRYDLMLTKKIAGKERDIPFSLESTGTQSLLYLLPYMLILAANSVTVIDEFDTGVHDLLVQRLADSLYAIPDGQLIMTTHSTVLMDNYSSIPKECFYMINELDSGDKEIEPITYYDPKIHENTNIRNQYFNGSYKALPELGVIDFEKLLEVL